MTDIPTGTGTAFFEIMDNSFKKLSTKWQEKKERRFKKCWTDIISNRGILAQLALDYYSNKKLSFNKFPLISKVNWIPAKPLDLNEIDQCKVWDYKEVNTAKLIVSYLPLKNKSYTENITTYFPKVDLQNRFVYRLNDINTKDGKFSLTFAPSHYYNYFNTCEILLFEFYYRLFSKRGKEPTERRIKSIYRKRFALRDMLDIFDLSTRVAAMGVSTLLIVLNKDGKGENYFYFHDREKVIHGSAVNNSQKESEKELAEAVNTFHVVPAGSFQPDSHEDDFHERDFSIIRNVFREFAEELLGKDEYSNTIKDEKDFMENPLMKKFKLLYDEFQLKLFFLGIGFDPLTTKPELLTCMIINGAVAKQRKISLKFKDNYEGEHMVVPFNKVGISRYLNDMKTLPAGKACLSLVEKHYEFFSKLF